MFTRILLIALLAAPPVPSAELSIDITQTADEDFGTAASLAKAAGATVTSLSLPWDAMTDVSGRYAPDIDWPTIANSAYPILGLDLTVTLSLIDTIHDRRPEAFRLRPWDHPEVIRTAKDLVTQVLTRLPDVALHALSIGNEVDGLLRTEEDIAAFARLLAETRITAERLRPGLPVGTKITFAALRQDPDRWAPLLAESTALQVTYYPLDTRFQVPPVLNPATDLEDLIAWAQGRPVQILEAGLPSGGCNSSEARQRDFVIDLLDAAEARADVTLVSLTWLTDLQSGEFDETLRYYTVSEVCFREFLRTLGLRKPDGTSKPAFDALKQRAGAD